MYSSRSIKRPTYNSRTGPGQAFVNRSGSSRSNALARARAGGSAAILKPMPIYQKTAAFGALPSSGWQTYSLRGWKNNNSELKYNDIASATYAFNTTGTVTALNLTAVGDDNTTRDGRQICNRSIHVQGLLFPADDATAQSLCRFMLVWDSQPNSGTIAAITDILVASTSITSTNLNNRERFTILRDKRYALGKIDNTATQAFSNGCNTYVINEFLNLKDIKTTYSGTTAAIGSVATGALLMVTVSDQAAGLGGTSSLTTRLRFTDR